jgi:DNA-binding transcriptional ArsR family regulator
MEDDGFVEKLKALASDASVKIIRVLTEHKPDPVPVRVISSSIGANRATTSKHLAALRKAHLVAPSGRQQGYTADTGEIKAVIGEQSYRRITRELKAQNDDTSGQSQD